MESLAAEWEVECLLLLLPLLWWEGDCGAAEKSVVAAAPPAVMEEVRGRLKGAIEEERVASLSLLLK